jgi:hypothetical protein
MSLSGGSTGEQRIATFLDVIEKKGIGLKDLTARIRNPIEFVMPQGGVANGFEATILADICDAVLAARKQGGILHPQQSHIAEQCEVLVRGFARVGITALIDEATGYQKARTADALATLMEEYLAKEVRPWARTFPPDYYKALCDAYDLPFSVVSGEYPGYFGHATNNLIYDRMLPGMRAELKGLKAARKTSTMHQGLSEKAGTKALSHMIGLATAALRLGKSRPAAEKIMDELGYPVQPRDADGN